MASIKRNPRTGKWFARVSYKKQDGSYSTKTQSGFTFKRDAEAWAASIEALKSNTLGLETADMPFADYFEQWCMTYKVSEKVREKTNRLYLQHVKLVHDFFKRTPLRDITRQHVQKFIDQRGATIGEQALKRTLFLITACFRHAHADGIITRNPSHSIVANSKKPSSDKAKHWTEEEYTKLVDYFSANPLQEAYMAVLIALLTGARIGEVFALRWDSFSDDTMTIKESLDFSNRKLTPPKNETSKRTIAIPDALRDALEQYKERHQQYLPEYLFIGNWGQPVMTHKTVMSHLRKACEELGVTPLGCHAARHTHCSILLARGLDIYYISKRLGHSGVTTTMRTYAHLLAEFEQTQNEMARAVLQSLSRAKS